MSKQKAAGKNWKRTLLYGFYIVVVVFLVLEILLRIYNPFQLRLKGDKIMLPVNQQLVIDNHINRKLDPVVTNTRNSLGFRGPELPSTPDEFLKVKQFYRSKNIPYPIPFLLLNPLDEFFL